MSAPGTEPTGYERPADGATGEATGEGAAPGADEAAADRPSGGDAGTPLTTDADAQRDDLPVRPGNEGS